MIESALKAQSRAREQRSLTPGMSRAPSCEMYTPGAIVGANACKASEEQLRAHNAGGLPLAVGCLALADAQKGTRYIGAVFRLHWCNCNC